MQLLSLWDSRLLPGLCLCGHWLTARKAKGPERAPDLDVESGVVRNDASSYSTVYAFGVALSKIIKYTFDCLVAVTKEGVDRSLATERAAEDLADPSWQQRVKRVNTVSSSAWKKRGRIVVPGFSV